MTEAELLIQWVLDKKIAKTSFDKFLNEQTIDITPFGIEINAILNKLLETSKESLETNIHAAEKLRESEQTEVCVECGDSIALKDLKNHKCGNCEWCDHLLENHTGDYKAKFYKGNHLGCQTDFCTCLYEGST